MIDNSRSEPEQRLSRSSSSHAQTVSFPFAIQTREGFRQHTCWRLLLLLLLIVFVQCDAHLIRADDAGDDFKIAEASYRQSRWKKAVDQFRKFLLTYEKHEKAPIARWYLGQSLVFVEDYKSARSELRRFVDENPQHANVRLAKFRIGECSFLLDDLPNAKIELEEFTKDYPDDAMGQYALPYLGETLLRLKDPNGALALFNSSLEKFPKGKLLDDAKFGRARSLEDLKKYDEAISHFQELIEREDGGRTADALFHLGGIYFERKNYDEAISAYSRFLKNHPANPLELTGHLNLGYAYFQSGQFDQAIRQFKQVTNDQAQGLRATYWLGRSYRSLGDYQRALEILKEASQRAGKQELADAILFQQALCERSMQHVPEARQAFEEVLKRFPTGEWADDSLHALIEQSIDSGELAEADQLLERFQKEYPQSGLRLHVELLHGRLNLSQASAAIRDPQSTADVKAFYAAAATRFERVMNDSSIERTKRQARYYLALTDQLADAPDKALELIGPLVDHVLSQGANSEFVDALVLQADCCQQKKEHAKAIESAGKYLELAPRGRQAARALSIRAMAAIDSGEVKVADEAMLRLIADFSDHALTSATLQKMAEAAEAREDWVNAGRMFAALEKSQRDPQKRAYAVRGIALSQYGQKQFAEAAVTFGRVASEFPDHEIATECAYFEADSLRRAEQFDAAIDHFQRLFNSYTGKELPEKGAEAKPPLEFYYKAGRWVANLLTTAKKIDQADAAYEALLKRFPTPIDLDKRLFEWAELNLQNKRFDRADEIWRRLLNDAPESPHATRARFNLAESDLMANKLEDAQVAFQKLIEDENATNEIKELSLYQLVTLAVDQQRWDDVRTSAKKLTSLFPASEHRFYANYSIAESLFAEAEWTEESRAVLREILDSLLSEHNNDKVRKLEWYDRVSVLMAELNYREGKYEEVESVVADLKKRDPNSPFLYQAEEVLGRSYKQRAPVKFEEARAAFERVLANPSAKGTETAAKAQFLIGDTWFHQRKFEEALAAYQKVFSLHEDFPEWRAESLLASARCDENQDDWKQAVETYQLLIKTFPSFKKIDYAKNKLEDARKRAGR